MANCLSVKRDYLSESSELMDSGEYRASTAWVVVFDGDTSPIDAQSASDGTTAVPIRGQAHPENSTYVASHITARPISGDSRRHFRVIVEYTTMPTWQVLTNPIGQVVVAYDYEEEGSEDYFVDFDPSGSLTNAYGTAGKAVVDTAGVPFEDFLTRGTGSLTCTYSQNLAPADFNPVTDQFPFWMGVNSEAFTIPASTLGGNALSLQPYQARVAGITCDGVVQTMNGVKYVVYKAVFKLRNDWRDYVESRGAFEKSSTAPAGIQPIAKLQPPTAMTARGWPLDSNGKACASITTTGAILNFTPYRPTDLSPIVAPVTA